MNAPTPYYQTPDGRVRLYHGDCREILPLVAPPSPRVLLLADPPYGVNANTRSRTRPHEVIRGGKRRAKAIKDRDFPPVVGDAEDFEPGHLLQYERAPIWGWNHFASRMPPSPSLIWWGKRGSTGADDGADGEVAWTNLGGPAREWQHLWRGTCRASETGTDHLAPTQKPEAFHRWLYAGRGRGKPIVSRGNLIAVPYAGSGPEIPPAMELGLEVVAIEIEREYLDTIIKHRIEPALRAARQIDIWAPRLPLAEQSELFAGGL